MIPELAIICITIIIIFFGYLWFKANEIYVDEPVAKGNIANYNENVVGSWVRYKRTYKNGKVTYHEVNYK